MVDKGLIDALFHAHEHIDEYCERLTPGLWAEPVNAITNFCIIFAGLYIMRLYWRDIYGRHKKHYPSFLFLSVLVVLLGVGSLLWHTFANGWSLWADMLPIILLIYFFQWNVLRKVFRWSRKEVGVYLVLFTLANIALTRIFGEAALNGSIIYAPAVGALIWFGVMMKQEKKRGANYMILAVFTFLAAITFRTFDAAVCDYFPIGTHFMWHVGNSVLVLFLAKALILGYIGHAPKRVKPTKRGLTM